MEKVTDKSKKKENIKMRPSLTPEGRENQMIHLAIGLAEKQLMEGTASSQVITHFLKLASSKEKDNIEKEILNEQKKLISAKTKSIENIEKTDRDYKKVLEAIKKYNGYDSSDIEEDEEYEN